MSAMPSTPSPSAASLCERAGRAAREYLATLQALGLSIEDALATIRELPAHS
ncbi:MAG TPA: hypothetical protein VH561_03200 [Micromonosporaceae bacterium]|jgi:hypothetical protein